MRTLLYEDPFFFVVTSHNTRLSHKGIMLSFLAAIFIISELLNILRISAALLYFVLRETYDSSLQLIRFLPELILILDFFWVFHGSF